MSLLSFPVKGRPLREQQEVAAAVIQRCYRKYKQVNQARGTGQRAPASAHDTPEILTHGLAKEHCTLLGSRAGSESPRLETRGTCSRGKKKNLPLN